MIYIKAKQVAAESFHDPSKRHADLTRSDNAHGFAGHIESDQPVEIEISLANPIIGFMDMPV